MNGKLKLIEVTESTPYASLQWERGSTPSVNVSLHTDETGMDTVFVPAQSETEARLQAKAERLQEAAIAVAVEKNLSGVVPAWIEVRLYDNRLKVGCWYSGSQGPLYKEWGPITTARIAEVAGVELANNGN